MKGLSKGVRVNLATRFQTTRCQNRSLLQRNKRATLEKNVSVENLQRIVETASTYFRFVERGIVTRCMLLNDAVYV